MLKFFNEDLMIFDYNKIDVLFDCVYSDPPWGEANLKYWRTINNQKGFIVDWHIFLHKLAHLINKKTKQDANIFIETGLRFKEDVVNVFKEENLFLQQIINCFYGNKKTPNLLLYFAKEKKQPLKNIYVNGGEKLVKSVLEQVLKQGDFILDPCCGLGTTAKIACLLNANFYGIELNKKRIEIAKEKAEKQVLRRLRVS